MVFYNAFTDERLKTVTVIQKEFRDFEEPEEPIELHPN
jgi:hypothetical protein